MISARTDIASQLMSGRKLVVGILPYVPDVALNGLPHHGSPLRCLKCAKVSGATAQILTQLQNHNT